MSTINVPFYEYNAENTIEGMRKNARAASNHGSNVGLNPGERFQSLAQYTRERAIHTSHLRGAIPRIRK